MSYSYKKQKNSKFSAPLKYFLLVLLLLVVGVIVYVYVFDKESDSNNTNVEEISEVNFSPPTEEELEAGDEIKDTIVNNDGNNNPINEANVVIVDASQYDDEIEVRAFVSNIIEEGTCEFVFSNASDSFVKSTTAKPDASTTPCVSLIVPRSEFKTPGEWNITVNYSGASSDTEGSNETTFTVN